MDAKESTNAGASMQSVVATTKSVDDIIGNEWYFWSNIGESFMGPGSINPILTTSVGEWSKFRIIAVDSDNATAKVAIEHTSKRGKQT